MKIEMGESLLYSWLRHIKECQIVQLNWKVSSAWDSTITKELIDLMDKINESFDQPFGNSGDLNQLIRQSEIDVIGFNFNSNTIYGVDVAFHINGLGYSDNVKNITKKIFRTLLTLDVYFENTYDKEVIFATPKVNPREQDKLDKRIAEINQFLIENSLDTKISFVSNENFKNEILNPVLNLSSDIADTSELFLRSYQLTQLFDKKTDKKVHVKTQQINAPSEPRIGRLVQDTFHYLFENNLLADSEISNLMNIEYSRETFGASYPILKLADPNIDIRSQRQVGRYPRYYARVFGEKYLLCNDWYEGNREPFKRWLLKASGT